MLEGIEVLADPKAWPILLIGLVLAIGGMGIVLAIGGMGIYHQFVDPSVYKLEMVREGCKDYITIPLIECKEGTELKFTHCRCSTQWVEVTDPAER